MNIQTGQLITVTLTMTEPEARAFLVDARPTQDQVRDALAELRASDDTRPGQYAFPRANYHIDGAKIARAAKKQNKKIKAARNHKHFLAPMGNGAFPCDRCEKTFDTVAILNRHKGRIHKTATEYLYPVRTADAVSAA